jgi:thioredoxin reductase (NADPH)
MYDVIIIGSGPAGFTAGIYCQRLGLHPVIVAGKKWGGQLQQTTEVENWPGTRSILGPELMSNMRNHAQDLGVPVLDEMAVAVTTETPLQVTLESGTVLEGKAIILAMGADTKWLGVPNEQKLWGRGVSACAPCDAFFFKGKPVAVVGGGDSAMEETHVIAKVASDVILIHRRDDFKAQQAMVDKAQSYKNVRFLYNTQVIDVVGDTVLQGLLLETTTISPKQKVASFDELVQTFAGEKRTGTTWYLPRAGVFVAIGLVPNTQIVKQFDTNEHGYLLRIEEKDAKGNIRYSTKTKYPGIFTAGDIHDHRYKQAITASAFGCMAALDVSQWLDEHHE